MIDDPEIRKAAALGAVALGGVPNSQPRHRHPKDPVDHRRFSPLGDAPDAPMRLRRLLAAPRDRRRPTQLTTMPRRAAEEASVGARQRYPSWTHAATGTMLAS